MQNKKEDSSPNNNLPAIIPDTLPTNPNTDDSTAIVSIFELQKFPFQVTKPCSFSPKKLKKCIDDYAQNNVTLAQSLQSYKIRMATFFDLITRSEEIRKAYQVARTRKAHIWDKKAMESWEELPEHPEFYRTVTEWVIEPGKTKKTKIERRELTTAAVRYLEARERSYRIQATQCETGTRVQRQQVESKSINLNVNATAEQAPAAADDLAKYSIDELMQQVNRHIKKA